MELIPLLIVRLGESTSSACVLPIVSVSETETLKDRSFIIRKSGLTVASRTTWGLTIRAARCQ